MTTTGGVPPPRTPHARVSLQRTPLYPEHLQLGARMVPFAGYEMPIQYTGIVAEHRAVREAAGLFDLSHMGEFHFDGAAALAAVDRLVSSDIAGLEVGQARYGLLCNEGGTIVDDVIVYRTAADHVLMVVNAANVEKDAAHVRRHLPKDVAFAERSADTALIAIQGPRAADILAKVAGGSVAALQPFGVKSTRAAGAEATIARTGYTGEDGFEVFIDNADAVQVWQALLVAGRGDALVPVGLRCGSRRASRCTGMTSTRRPARSRRASAGRASSTRTSSAVTRSRSRRPTAPNAGSSVLSSTAASRATATTSRPMAR